MKNVKEIMCHARSSVVKLFTDFSEKMKPLAEKTIEQGQNLTNLEVSVKPSLHAVEEKQEQKTQIEIERHDAMDNTELKVELTKKYGTTKWAKNLIGSIMKGRS